MAAPKNLQDYLKSLPEWKSANKEVNSAQADVSSLTNALASTPAASKADVQRRLNEAKTKLTTAKSKLDTVQLEATSYYNANPDKFAAAKTAEGVTNLEDAKRTRDALAARGQSTAVLDKRIAILEGKIEGGFKEKPKLATDDKTNIAPTTESINTDLDTKIGNARQFLFDLGEKGRTELSQTLKDAGFPVKVEGKFPNDSLLNYYVNSLKSAKSQNETNKDVVGYVPVKWDSYVSNLIKSGTGDETKLPDPFGTQQIYNKSTAEGVIDNLFQNILKRDASQSEIDSLFNELQAEQKKLSSMSKGTYKMVNGRQVLVKEEGLDPRVFLENKIKELPAYKESQAAKSEQNKLSLASTALANGYDLERDFGDRLPNWLDAINKGESISKFQSTIRNSARNALPEAVKNSIDPNEDLTTAFATYISNFSKTFGVPVSQVSLNKILPLATNDKGFIPIYEFEKKKRQLAEWDTTQEARTETAGIVSTVLRDFGFKG
jgi:hypothetical protein